MSRVTIRVETDSGEVEVTEECTRRTWQGGDIDSLETLLDRALVKVCAAYDILPDPKTRTNTVAGVTLSDTNRAILYKAYDDGAGGTFSLSPGEVPGYFEGQYDGDYVMEGTEVNGVLYSICPQSGGGLLSVYVGNEINEGGSGTVFRALVNARTHIRELTAT